MQHHLNPAVWLVGTGYMGKEYAKVLRAQGVPFAAICRSSRSAEAFEQETGAPALSGGLEAAYAALPVPETAIVAISILSLLETTTDLIAHGVRRILLEKPAGLDFDEIHRLRQLAEAAGAEVFVAYNRRFYASVRKARELAAEDGGVTSFFFEFTEWAHQIEGLDKPAVEKENWFLANSTHVVDLAFFLGGAPRELSSYTGGSLSWYSKASAFAGAGVSATGAVFSYRANWESAGRWSVELQTKRRRLILCPLEGLKEQLRGSLAVTEIALDDALDRDFKPGLYLQTEAFLSGQTEDLLPLGEHDAHCAVYRRMEQPSAQPL